MTITALDDWGTGTDGSTSQASASVSPTTDYAVVVGVICERFNATPTKPTISDGFTGVTWTEIDDFLFDTTGNEERITIWATKFPSGGGSGTITIGFNSETMDYRRCLCFETDEGDLSGTISAWFDQTKRGSTDSSASSEAVTLDTTPTEPVFGIFATEDSSNPGVGPGTGFTEIQETTHSGSTNGTLQSQYDLTPVDAVVDATFSASRDHTAFVWEVKAVPAAATSPSWTGSVSSGWW